MRRLLIVAVTFPLAYWAYDMLIPQSPARGQTRAVEGEAGVALQILDWKETEQLIAGHKGKVVVVDAWSTSCEPCIREFPGLVALHEKHGDKVACVSLACDYIGLKKKPPEFYRDRVLAFLKKQNATFDNVLSSVPSDELFEKLSIPAIPAVMVYGPDGKLVKRFDNSDLKPGEEEFTYKDVTKYVESLLK